MNALGIVYLVLAGVAGVLFFVHLAQALVIRSDRSQGMVAAMCLGFAGLDAGIAFSSEATGAAIPPWAGWHLIAAASAVLLTLVVPLTAWQLLERKLNRARFAVIAATAALGLARAIGLASVLLTEGPARSWERLHSLDHPVLALVSVAAAVVGAGTWVVEGTLAWRAGLPLARPMTLFGGTALVASVQGVGVVLGLLPPPDLFGLMALPVMAFVQVLSSVRFVRAFQTAHQPAGDMARYEVLRKLGAGGMGDIFLARRTGPAGFLREVVLKQLQSSVDPVGRERFLAEARLAAALRHPNIVDVYDLGEQPGGFFIVMEFISGVTLGEVLKKAMERGQPIPADAVAELGSQMCRALSFAHAAQVIHRDIKRQNVMVSFAGQLKLIDFGIAQEQLAPLAERRTTADGAPEPAGGLTADQGVIGTFGYIAPERYQGQPASVASDLFAVGVVLYELLAQAPPFRARNTVAFLDEVNARAAPRLASVRGDLPLAMTVAIEACLAPSPADRPASAAQLQVALEQALAGRRFDLGKWVNALFPGDGAFTVREEPAQATAPAQRSELPTAEMKGKR